MTIESLYSRETFAINPARTYAFTFEHIGAEAIKVYEADAVGELTLISDSAYTLTEFLQGPVFQGGTVTYTSVHLATSVQVVIARSTPETQLVDYEEYDPFPAEVHEFALDKLTMIAQEAVEIAITGGDGGGVGIDPGQFIPISGTVANNPITGVLEMNSLGHHWSFGIIGSIFDGLFLTDLLQDGNQTFTISVNNIWTGINSKGEVLVNTVYDGSEPSNTLVTAQYVIDAIGGPTGTFIPLAGTGVGEEVTGVVTWLNGLTAEMNIGNSAFDVFTISVAQIATPQAFIINTGDTTTAFPWIFGEDGELTLPSIDYSLVADEGAVNKKYVDDAVASGGNPNTFIPLAGTDVGFPVTSTIEFNNTVTNTLYTIGVSNAVGFEKSLLFGAKATSITDSRIHFVTGNAAHTYQMDEFGDFHTEGLIVSGDSAMFGSLDVGGVNGIDVTGGNVECSFSIAADVSLNAGNLTITGRVLEVGALGAIVQGDFATNQIARLDVDNVFAGSLTVNGANGIDCTTSISATVSLNAGNLTTVGDLLQVTSLGGIIQSGIQASSVSLNGHVHNQYALLTGATFSGNVTCPDFDCTGNAAAGQLLAGNLSPSGVNLVAGGLGSIVPDASDVRLKESIYQSNYGLSHIMQMAPVEFSWKAGTGRATGRQVGFIAQDMMNIIPEAVPYSEEHDLYGFQDRPIIAALVRGMQEQQKQIDELKKRLGE